MGTGLGLGGAGLVLLLVGLGCSGPSSGESAVGPPASPQRPAAAAAPALPGVPAGLGWGPVDSAVTSPKAYIIASGGEAADGSDGSDVVWLDFTGAAPRCVAEYVSPPVRDRGTAEAVRITGRAFLRVRCSPVDAMSMPPLQLGIPGARYDRDSQRYRFGAGGALNVLEGVQTDFVYGAVTWTLGMRHARPFAIRWLGQADGRGRQTALVVILQ